MRKHDAANNLVGISVNGSAFVTTAHSVGIRDTANDVIMTPDGPFQDVTVLRGYAFTDADAAELWNSGAGVPFSSWGGGGGGQMTGDEGGVINQHATIW